MQAQTKPHSHMPPSLHCFSATTLLPAATWQLPNDHPANFHSQELPGLITACHVRLRYARMAGILCVDHLTPAPSTMACATYREAAPGAALAGSPRTQLKPSRMGAAAEPRFLRPGCTGLGPRPAAGAAAAGVTADVGACAAGSAVGPGAGPGARGPGPAGGPGAPCASGAGGAAPPMGPCASPAAGSCRKARGHAASSCCSAAAVAASATCLAMVSVSFKHHTAL